MAVTVAAIRAEISTTGGPKTRREIESVGDAVTKTADYADKLGAGMLAAVQTVRQAIAAARAAASGTAWRGVYTAGSKMLGSPKGPLGGAIVGGWERLQDGFWKSISTGVIKKGILAEDGGYVNPGFYAAGQGAGNAFTNGVRDSLQMHSPSRVMIGIGQNAANSFATGFERSYTSPQLGFATSAASIPSPRRGNQFGAAAQGGKQINVTVHVAGNVTAEDDLKLSIVRAVSEGIVEGTRQRNRAMGVT